jgi:hypothetical protein
MSDGGVSVVGFAEGFAAARSGKLFKDDLLLEIDNQFVGDDLAWAQGLLRGPHKSSVVLKIRRSTERVLLLHRRHLLSKLVSMVAPLRRVMVHVLRVCSREQERERQKERQRQKDRQRDKHSSSSSESNKQAAAAADKGASEKKKVAAAASSLMFRYNTEAQTGLIEQVELDPLLCNLLCNYELRLFGCCTLPGLSTAVANALALLPESEAHRMSPRELEAAAESHTVGYLLEQLELMLTEQQAACSLASVSYEDLVYLSRDLLQQEVIQKLNHLRVRFLRQHVPDALARQINSNQLTGMMTYGFILNRVRDYPDGSQGLLAVRPTVRPQSGGRLDIRRRSRVPGRAGGSVEGPGDDMFKVSFADLDRLLGLPLRVLLQMGQEPPRSLSAAQIERARIVFGLEKKGMVYMSHPTFRTLAPDAAAHAAMHVLRSELAANFAYSKRAADNFDSKSAGAWV